jgi:hypothetical protein
LVPVVHSLPSPVFQMNIRVPSSVRARIWDPRMVIYARHVPSGFSTLRTLTQIQRTLRESRE